MRRKLLALLLVLVMVVSIMPLAAYAEGEDDTTGTSTVTTGNDNNSDDTSNNGDTDKSDDTDNNGGDTDKSDGTDNSGGDTDKSDGTDNSGGDTDKSDDTDNSGGDTDKSDDTDNSADTDKSDDTDNNGDDANNGGNTNNSGSTSGGSTVDPATCNHQGFEDDCICDICGAEFHYITVEATETQHHMKCACGEINEWADHLDSDGDGLCDDCRRVIGNHEHHAKWAWDQDGHGSYCDSCFEELSEWAEHTMVNGTCSVCGYHPCEDGNHTYGTAGYEKHICQSCGYRTSCEDENKDCACDICGQEFVYADDWTRDAQSHWAHCTVCGKDYWKENHADANKDGKCDTCGYAMNASASTGTGAGGNDSGLDNVPKTGDVSILVMGAMVLLFGTGAVLAVKKYAI